MKNITAIIIVIRHRFQIVVDFSEKICLSIIDAGQIDDESLTAFTRFMKIHGDSKVFLGILHGSGDPYWINDDCSLF